MTIAQVKYVGATPGADSNNYILFSTALSEAGQGFLPMSGTHKVHINIAATQNGTLKTYKAQVRDANNAPTWVQTSTEAVTVTAGTAVERDYLVEALVDFKVEWTNGGVAQATWLVDVALTDQRASF